MKDDNFLKENNARHMWHPMGAPGDSLEHPPTIIKSAHGVKITDLDGAEVVDAVGGLWCVNLGYSNDVVKDAIAKQLYELPYYSAFAGTSNPTAIEASYAVREFFKDDGMGASSLHRAALTLWRHACALHGSITASKGSRRAPSFSASRKAITVRILAARV